MIYLVIACYILFLSYYYDFSGHIKGKKYHYAICLVSLILLAGFRYRLGIDSIRYEYAYNKLPYLSQLTIIDFKESRYDPLFLLLSSFARTISEEFWVLQMMQAILVNVIFFRFFKKNTRNYFFAIFLYFSLLYISNMTETMRESCAIAMLLLAWEHYLDNKKFKMLICCVIAYLFHSSSIILLLIYLFILLGLDTRIKFSRIIFLSVFAVFVFAWVIHDVFADLLNLLTFSSRLSGKAEMYTDNGLFASRLNMFGIATISILYGVIPYACSKSFDNTRFSKCLEFFLVIELFCAAISFPIAIFYRYINYFLPFVILAVCKTLEKSYYFLPILGRLRTSMFFSWLLLSSLYLGNSAKYYLKDEEGTKFKVYTRYYPYKSIFTKETDSEREGLYRYYGL